MGGYSLLEMLVVLAILGLIAAVAVTPISTSLEHMRLSADTRILAGALREAREEALNQQRDVGLTIDTQATNNIASSAGEHWTLSGGSAAAFVAVDGGPRTFAFHEDGTASGGTFRITRGKAEASIRVDDVTGAVEAAK